MVSASDSRRPAFLCASLLLVCAIVTYPVAEIGINDDWSYVQSVRILAQTGHIVYNGWSAPILGWQLFLGALFVKVFGPSFTAIRASELLVALFTAFLTHRTLVRTGVNSRNATVGTLALVLSPIFLPLAVTFMTDMGGLFCVVVCLYACLRAVQAQSDRAVIAWLAFAALSNALGGTVRQIAWLGVLVMFPCAVWLLRRRRHVLRIGGLLYAVSILFIYGVLHWYQRQPYSSPEHLLEGYPSFSQLDHLAVQLLSLFLSGALFLLPVLVAFASKVPLRNQRAAAFLAWSLLSVSAASIFLVVQYPNTVRFLVAPFRGDYVSPLGIVPGILTNSRPPLALSIGFRLCITVVVLLTLIFFFAFLFISRHTSEPAHPSGFAFQLVPWPRLLILLVPFTLAYVALLLPRGLRGLLLDRYLLILLPIALILLLRLYQDRAGQDLPMPSSALVLLFAVYAVAGTHDAFSRSRAQHAAIEELRSAGIPATSIDGGFAYNAMTQIETSGHIVDSSVFIAARDEQPSRRSENCEPIPDSFTPVIVPGYILSFDPAACGGLSRFAPVTYYDLLTHRTVAVYVVNAVNVRSGQR